MTLVDGPRIFSYLPNPRVWKATITARLCGVGLDIVGAPASELPDWIWDFHARRATSGEREALHAIARRSRRGLDGKVLLKTDAFLAAHPFGAIPAAFSPDGRIGVFESNSIMRLVALLSAEPGRLLGTGPYAMARVNSFLDVSLLFSHDIQRYLLGLRAGSADPQAHAIAAHALEGFLDGVDRALACGQGFITGCALSLADICFACDLALIANERSHSAPLRTAQLEPIARPALGSMFPHAFRHFRDLSRRPEFQPDFDCYRDKLEQLPFAG